MARPDPPRRRPRLPHPRLILAAAALAVVAAACGAGTQAATTTSGWTLPDVVGSWTNGDLTLLVGGDGSYIVGEAGPETDVILMSGFVARDGVMLDFVTAVGGECSGMTGVYRVDLGEATLSLSLVEDPCQFRAERFSSEWSRSESTSSRSLAVRSL